MKASELRIGNYVSNPPLSDCRKIDYLDIRDHAESRLIQPFDPIPLTEEWLIKFGFFVKEEISNDNFFGCHLYQNNDEFVIPYENTFHYIRDISSSEHDGSTEYRTTEIKYVHQLQNLYFALTGEELTIKDSLG
jgi:hypothetical protein